MLALPSTTAFVASLLLLAAPALAQTTPLPSADDSGAAAAVTRIRSAQHGELPRAEPVARSGTGPAGVTVVNRTAYTLKLYFTGSVNRTISVPPGETSSVELPTGSYEEAAEVVGARVQPFYGTHTQEAGTSYRALFYLAPR